MYWVASAGRTPKSALRVNGNLTLSTGILEDGGNTITVTGNIINTANHTGHPTDGGIRLAGTISLTLTGDDTFCDGDAAEIEIQYTSQTPEFPITITREKDEEEDETYQLDNIDIPGSPHQWLNYPVWDGETVPPNNIFTYRAIMVDANNCESLPTPPRRSIGMENSRNRTPASYPQYLRRIVFLPNMR